MLEILSQVDRGERALTDLSLYVVAAAEGGATDRLSRGEVTVAEALERLKGK